MNVSTSQVPVSLPQRHSALSPSRGAVAREFAAPVAAVAVANAESRQSPAVELQRLANVPSNVRGGLLIYSITANSSPVTGAQIDVRV